MIRTIINLLVVLFLVLPSCTEKAPTGVVQATAGDLRLVAATEEARRRFPEFERAFANRKPNTAYAVKVAMPVKDGGSEHLWLQVDSIAGDSITGRIDNEPQFDIGHKLGDVVTVSKQEIEDWLIGEGPGKITGAFSIKALQEIEKENK